MYLFIQFFFFVVLILDSIYFPLLNLDYTYFSLLLSITFRYSNFSPALGVHSACDQEAQVSVHGVLGEQEGGAVPLP